MPRIRMLIALLFVLIPLGAITTPGAANAETRIALVIGNAAYQVGGPLNTAANDAGLIAQTLQAAGFDVVGARDLDQDSLRHAFRDFVEKATGAGPDTVAFVYVSGYGLQLEGENYFVPIDAKIAHDSDVPSEALRISDYSRPLAALKLKAAIVVLDAARANPFAKSGPPLAGGLALVDPEPGLLVAFNSAPGTVAPDGQGPYGPYAQALAEMLREGGLPLTGVFDRARLRVNEMTQGAEIPWHASKVETTLVFFERAPDAPPPAVPPEEVAAIRSKPLRDVGAQEAYVLALERDTLDGYNEFLADYPDDPMAKRVRVIVAARRESITWRRTRVIDTPPAYWSYLRRYPDGPHRGDARRRLAYLAAAFEPPPTFAAVDYDVPPPPPEEIVYVRRPVLVFSDPFFAFAPPPPVPVVFLAPPPPAFVVLAPPPPVVGLFVLPCPVFQPMPVWVRPPAYVAAPPANNVIFNNIHNTVVINNVTNTVTVTNQSGQTRTITPPVAAAAGPGGSGAGPSHAGFGPSLPPAVAQKAALQTQSPAAGGAGAASSTPPKPGLGQPLPGMQGHPLPAAATAPGSKPGAPTAPSAAVTPSTTPAPGVGKPALGQKPVAPSAAVGSTSPSPATAPSGSTKPAAKKPPPAAKLTPPVSPPSSATSNAPAAVAHPTPPAPPHPAVAPPAAAAVHPPVQPPAPPHPAAAPPHPAAAAAPPKPPAPAAAAAKPAPQNGKNCPIVNGHPVCK